MGSIFGMCTMGGWSPNLTLDFYFILFGGGGGGGAESKGCR